MEHKILAPSVGESITEVRILEWLKQDGEAVSAGDVLLEIETDKASVEVAAESDGVLKIIKDADEVVPVGEVLAVVDDEGKATVQSSKKKAQEKSSGESSGAVPAANGSAGPTHFTHSQSIAGPAARKMAAERGVDLSQMKGSAKGARVSKSDLLNFQTAAPGANLSPVAQTNQHIRQEETSQESVRALRPGERRKKMSRLRQTIAERLVRSQQTAAILTTFNEVDLHEVMQLRSKHKEAYKKKHGVGLSFMSFFTRACVKALKEVEGLNASIENKDIIYRDFAHIGIAVGTDRGLVVPVIKNAQDMSFVEIDQAIVELATKARDGKLSIADMSDGTFTISNGGTYGSMMSTPILNPPQTGILGMHNIVKRPMVVKDKVEIRPMMYLALSYDHRVVDGKEAVTFLVTVKKLLESPEDLDLDFI